MACLIIWGVISLWCAMIQGPCRGKTCDFWARVKLRKVPLYLLVADMRKVTAEIMRTRKVNLETAIEKYWQIYGLKDVARLKDEDSELWNKLHKAIAQL